MSRTWWLTTNSKFELEDIQRWLFASENWTGIEINYDHQRLVAKSNDSTLTLICTDIAKLRPGTAENAIHKIGTSATIIFTQELSRMIDHCGRLDEIYEFAFGFASWDKDCDLYFELEDRGIFKRMNNKYVVNPDQFFAESLARFLTFQYTFANSDKRNELLVTKV